MLTERMKEKGIPEMSARFRAMFHSVMRHVLIQYANPALQSGPTPNNSQAEPRQSSSDHVEGIDYDPMISGHDGEDGDVIDQFLALP